ncbi:MAG: sigma-54-dependent Fis family transcriptional regulator [Acidobacteria bacterium]|nr:sigma-54-dependent Fis family transcriptional regulator [Acidobacteriota bacterium]MCB9398447.1 sigma-54-dependent Fis family transcriptional regulator [Acidobacteriota bacterium]
MTEGHRSFIVLVDDEAEMRSVLQEFLESEGCAVRAYERGDALLRDLEPDGGLTPIWLNQGVDLVITDQNMPGISGLDLLHELKEKDAGVPVILITAFGSIDNAIEATRRGAFDYIQKPFTLSEVKLTLDRAIKFRELEKNYQMLRQEVRHSFSFQGLLGKSKQMLRVFELMKKVAPTQSNIMITGESGTGKELVAKGIHQLSTRANRTFVALNCSAIPENLLESELFGHVRGAFTGAIQNKRGLFEEADGGTLFLDEIGDMPLHLQAKLLRVLQEKRVRPVGGNVGKKVDVRLLAATHMDLKQAIRQGTFREDLYYRLCVIPIHLPALRERREDIPLLAEFFLSRFRAENNVTVNGFSRGAMAALMRHRWEGNVRELENLIERTVVLCSGSRIAEGDLPALSETDPHELLERAGKENWSLQDLERQYIRQVLQMVGGRKERAAEILGINRRTLYRKEREYGLVHPFEGV